MKENHDSELKVAEDHADWYSDMLMRLSKKIYKDAFIHGYNHGWTDHKSGHTK